MKQRTWQKTAEESIHLFSMFGHGLLKECPDTPEDFGDDREMLDNEPPVVLRACAKAGTVEKENDENSGKYHVETFDEQAAAEELEKILQVISKQKIGADSVSTKVFTEGSQESKDRWYGAAKKEVDSMESMEVWDELPEEPDALRESLGLSPGDKLPSILPMSIVCTEKPVVMQQDKKVMDQGAAAAAEQARAAILEKVRLVVCGNFEDTSGVDPSPYASSNVDATCLRVMHSELAAHEDWEGMAFDVSNAFLYSELKSENTSLMRPPKLLQTLGLLPKNKLLRAKKGIYGLRSSPVSWEFERNELDGQILSSTKGDELPQLKVEAVSDYAGMWVVRKDDDKSIVAVVSMFVDDGIAFGKREALLRFGELVSKRWKTKWQGLLGRTRLEGSVTRGNVALEYTSEIIFIGAQV